MVGTSIHILGKNMFKVSKKRRDTEAYIGPYENMYNGAITH